MAPNPRRIAARLQALYDRIPTGFCRGLCSDSCGIVHPTMSKLEVDRIEALDVPISKCEYGGWCPALKDGRCTVYDVRPVICRLYGAAENLRCPYGCVPAEGLLPADVGVAIMVEALEIGGMVPGQRDIANAEVKAMLADPTARKRILQGEYLASGGARFTIAGRNEAIGGELPVIHKDHGKP